MADDKTTPLRHSTSRALLKSLRERHWGARYCFPCLDSAADNALYEMCKEAEKAVDDSRYDEYDFSLLKGTYYVGDSTPTIELNGTDDEPLDEEGIKLAIARFKAFYDPLIPVGCSLYALMLGGGFLSGYFCDCTSGPALWGFAFPAIAIPILLYWLDKLTVLLSQTEVEKRCVLLLLKGFTGINDYRVMSGFTCLNAFSRFTRAQFVGYVQHCHGAVDKPFEEAYKNHGIIGRIMGHDLGIAGLSVISFVLGPLLIQFGYMFWLRRQFRAKLLEVKTKQAGQTLDITGSLDNLGALAEWAMLQPIEKVMEAASVPIHLDCDEDVDRLWSRMVTACLEAMARNIPDGILQMELQSWFLCIVFPDIGWFVKAQLLLNIVLAGVGVVGDSVDLLLQNRRVTVGTAMLLCFMMCFSVSRTIMAFVCKSHIENVDMNLFHCVPNGMIHHANWTSGVLPG